MFGLDNGLVKPIGFNVTVEIQTLVKLLPVKNSLDLYFRKLLALRCRESVIVHLIRQLRQ
jgi:hypothetical protein